MMKKAASPESMKKSNQSLILNTIRTKGPISRAKLSRIVKLSPPTVSRIVDFFLQEGIVSEVGKEESIGGRKAVLLEFNSNIGYVIGVDIGEVKIRAALGDLKGNIVEETFASTFPHKGGDITLKQLITTLHTLFNRSKVKRSEVKMIGVSVPSPVDRTTGKVILASTIDGWRNLPLKDILQTEFEIPVLVENNVNMAAIGEKCYGTGGRNKNLIYVAVSTGIGTGIILEDKLYYGTRDLAGEISHMAIEKDSWQKDYGFHGCLETLISGDAMVEEVKDYIKKGYRSIIPELVEEERISPDVIFTAASKGDKLAREAVTKISRYLGIAIANLVSVLDPEIVVLGGDIVLAGEFPLEIISGIVKRLAPALPEIVLSKLGNKASMYGAVAMVLDKVLKRIDLPEMAT